MTYGITSFSCYLLLLFGHLGMIAAMPRLSVWFPFRLFSQPTPPPSTFSHASFCCVAFTSPAIPSMLPLTTPIECTRDRIILDVDLAKKQHHAMETKQTMCCALLREFDVGYWRNKIPFDRFKDGCHYGWRKEMDEALSLIELPPRRSLST